MARYEIIIKNESNETDQEAYAEKLPTNEDMGGTPSKTSKGESKKAAKPSRLENVRGGIRAFRAFASSSIILGVGKDMFMYKLNRVGIETGNQHKQDIVNFHMSVASSAMSVGMGFLMGGPIGGFGAMAGIGLNYAQKMDAYNFEKQWDSVRRNELIYRAGPSFNRSRI